MTHFTSCLEELCLGDIDHNWWGLLLELVLAVVSFIGLARVCDEYMVPSLESLCLRWKVREDVAGATFLAFGGAAPEIVISTVTTVTAASKKGSRAANLGVSSIIGSGIIAFLFIPGLSAIAASKRRKKTEEDSMQTSLLSPLADVAEATEAAPDSTDSSSSRVLRSDSINTPKPFTGDAPTLISSFGLIIKRRPLARDCVFFLASLVMLCLFLRDGKVGGNNGLLLLLLYVVYLLVLYFSPKVRHWYQKRRARKRGKKLMRKESFVVRVKREREAQKQAELLQRMESPLLAQEEEEEEESGKLGVFVERLCYPVDQLLRYTVPSCELHGETEGRWPITFTMSILWVGIFSFLLSAIVTRWVKLSHAPMSFFGVTVVAIGAQIPDTIQSVMVAKRGYGSMAVANAIGSQITNICIGLGMPWWIVSLADNTVTVDEHYKIQICGFFLIGSVFLFFLLTVGWAAVKKLPKVHLEWSQGWFLTIIYFVAMAAYAVLLFTVL